MLPFAFPKNYIRVTQQFKGIDHPGIDFGGVRIGDEVVWCIGDGEVVETGYQATGAGHYVKVYHKEVKMTSVYFHLASVQVDVGDITTKNTQLGIEGATGNVTGPHLHFGLYQGEYERYTENYVNPLDYLYAYPEQVLYAGDQGNLIDEVRIYEEVDEDVEDTVEHWAEAHFQYLNDKGVTVHERRFDEVMTRGEMMALSAGVIRRLIDNQEEKSQ